MTSPQKKPEKAKPQPRADVSVHDHIYFRHDGVPVHGRVIALGGHGCTVDHDGQQRRVRWEQMLGHRKRFRPQTNIVDSGEDGAIVQDENGRRVFVAGLVADEEEMGKALLTLAGPELSLRRVAAAIEGGEDMLKALKNAPGLSLQGVTDKAGNQTKRWKRTSEEQKKGREPGKPEQAAAGKPKAAMGDMVSFAHGDAKASGKVVASGKDGALVEDSTGRQHQVRWSEVTDHKPAPDNSAAMTDASGSAEQHAAPFFSLSEVSRLPKAARQPHQTLEELYAHAPESLRIFKEKLEGVAGKLNLVTGKKPDDLSESELASPNGYLFVGTIKSEQRAREKAETDYKLKKTGKPEYARLRDIVRATISVPDVGGVREAIKAVKDAGLKLAQRPKDRFQKPTYEGYRDILTVVKLPNGMLAELQFHVKPMTAAKSECHALYEEERTLIAQHGGDEKPTESWSDADHTRFYELVREQRQIYGAAWDQATKATGKEGEKQDKTDAPEPEKEGLQKSTFFGKFPFVMFFSRRA